MLLISYDISDNKLRTRFAKFLSKFGYRLQYSVFEIKNSKRMLGTIQAHIQKDFENQFQESDSVIIFHMSQQCKIMRYGYAKNDESDLKIIL